MREGGKEGLGGRGEKEEEDMMECQEAQMRQTLLTVASTIPLLVHHHYLSSPRKTDREQEYCGIRKLVCSHASRHAGR